MYGVRALMKTPKGHPWRWRQQDCHSLRNTVLVIKGNNYAGDRLFVRYRKGAAEAARLAEIASPPVHHHPMYTT